MTEIQKDTGIFEGLADLCEDLNGASMVPLFFSECNGDTLSGICILWIELQCFVEEFNGTSVRLGTPVLVLIGIAAHFARDLQENVAHASE